MYVKFYVNHVKVKIRIKIIMVNKKLIFPHVQTLKVVKEEVKKGERP